MCQARILHAGGFTLWKRGSNEVDLFLVEWEMKIARDSVVGHVELRRDMVMLDDSLADDQSCNWDAKRSTYRGLGRTGRGRRFFGRHAGMRCSLSKALRGYEMTWLSCQLSIGKYIRLWAYLSKCWLKIIFLLIVCYHLSKSTMK